MSCAGGCGFTVNEETTLGELIEAFPAVEEALTSMAPSLSALKDPLMRGVLLETVTLGRLAEGEGLPLTSVIGRVRHAAGMEPVATPGDGEARPDWADPTKCDVTLDAREMLGRGEHPAGAVLQGTASLPPGGVFLLVTPFVPTPLIQRVKSQGFEAYTVEVEPGKVENYFRRS